MNDFEKKKRLDEAREQHILLKKWGPDLSERQSGKVREDYRDNGDAWNYFTHDQAPLGGSAPNPMTVPTGFLAAGKPTLFYRILCSVVFFLAVSSTSLAQQYPGRYMGKGDAKLITAPNGVVIYDKAFAAAGKIVYTKPTVEKVADGIWVIGGYGAANCTVIDAPEGLIVYDTGDNAEEGKHFREVIEKDISKKPIKAIIYSHSHYATGGGTMVDDPTSVLVVGHPKLNDTVRANLQGGGAPSAIPEIGPVLTARAVVQFSNFLPKQGEDASIAPSIVIKTPAFLPVTQPVEDGQSLTVAGLEMQFFTKYISDDYSVTVWIPSKKAVLNNFFWPGTPNLYSLRGALYRDPQIWRDGLKVIRDLQPEVLLNTHPRAIVGKQQVSEALVNYMDLITLTYDQTLRGILHGLGPDELRYFIYKPKRLTDEPSNAETYGETPWFPPAIALYAMGWYDREPATIFQIPVKEEAARLVTLMDGRDKVVAAARASLEKKEYAWAAQLINYIYRLDPNDKDARQIKADALRKLGQLAMGSIGRSFLISEARALEGKEQIPKVFPPAPAAIGADPATFVNYYRVRIDPERSENEDTVIAFAFPDKTVALHVRRGIVEYIPDPTKYLRKPDITLTMDGATWAKLYLNQTDLKQAAESGAVKLTQGNAAAATKILDLFDKFDPIRNVTIPSHEE